MRVLIQEKTQRKKVLSGLLSRKAIFTLLTVMLAFFIAMPAYSQNVRVKGHVSDENGQPVAKVSVVVKGTTNGVSGDDNGDFEITAPANGTLVISAVNFIPQEVRINNKQSLSVTLVSTAKTESEVVVIGYGTQRREAVTGSVASINGNTMREVPSSNITQALQGRLAGVEISQTDTKPGATMQIRIRGQRSLSGSNDPLIVLDGIPFTGSIADVNPTDIKSIDVLKDASATAIYGSRGANGVILITTNRGQRRQKPQITYNGRYSDITMFSKYPMMNGPEFVALRTLANQYQTPGTDEDNNLNTDWQSMFFRTGLETSHDVGLTGGSETGSYSVNLGYYLNQGVIPTQRYTRYSLKMSLDQDVGKYIRVGFSTNSNYNVNAGNQVNGAMYNVLSMTPISNPYNPDGSLKRTIKMPLDEQFVFTRSVVDSLKDLWLQENRGYASYNSMYGELKIPGVKGLTYRVNLGMDFVQENTGSYTGVGIGSANATTPSTASVDNRHTFHYVVENLLTYDHTFAQNHHVNVVALYSAEQNKYNRSYMAAKNIPSDAFQFYNLGQSNATDITVDPNQQDYQLWGLESWMGRVMYSYKNRYFLSAAVRSDGSSRLAPGHQWHTYPAVSAGWNIKDESFMQNVSFLDKLKLRVGYGETSNQAIAPYSTLGRLATTPYNFGPTGYATGYYVSQLPNSKLGWEYSQTYNVGLDFTLFKNRLSGTIEYYITKTKDILLGLGLPPTSGVSSYTANIGQSQNKGIELNLNGTILNNVNGWTLEAGMNLYANRNKLVALASGQKQDVGNAWFVGYNINAIYDYKKIGLWTSSKDSADNYMNILQPGGKVGMIKVQYTGDYNNGVPTRAIGPDDRQVMNVDPDFEGGFNTRLSYKEFDFDMVAFFRSGGILISTLNGPSSYLNLESGRRNNIKIDYWTPTNTGAKYPKPGGPASGDNPMYASTLSYFNGSYVKFRTMSLGYTFLENKWSWMKKSGINNLRVYFTVQNPFVMFSPFHKETGLDPETNSYGNQNVATGGYQFRLLTVGFNTPSTRNYVFGINMSL
jgi:TonB-linked SusC/RagA family outer membrane protein